MTDIGMPSRTWYQNFVGPVEQAPYINLLTQHLNAIVPLAF